MFAREVFLVEIVHKLITFHIYLCNFCRDDVVEMLMIAIFLRKAENTKNLPQLNMYILL